MAKKPKTNPDVPLDRLSKPARWHKKLSVVTGELSMCLVHGKMTRGQVNAWIAALREVEEEMDASLG